MTHDSWNIELARNQYRVQHWSDGYFDINEAGNVIMKLPDEPRHNIDLYQLATQVHNEGLRFPLLIRFVNILHDRAKHLQAAFNKAIIDCGHKSCYTAIYPIKVNQQRSVLQEIINGGNNQIGLEAGSKPELIAVLGSAPFGSTIICNGYKDREYLRLALIGKQMGHKVFIVIEKPSELFETLEESESLKIEPLLGIRVRLSSLGKGKWQNTGGEKSKFGLSAAQAIHMVDYLKSIEHLDYLQLLHFHMGSQIPNIQDIQRGMREASRYFLELNKIGANIRVVDVGGGLGVNYEGLRSCNECSVNYTIQEYANTIIRCMADVCEENNIKFPDFLTESGRAMTAHHAVLITNVIDTDPQQPEEPLSPEKPKDNDPIILHNLYRLYKDERKLHPSEIYHEAAYWLDEAQGMYSHGRLSLNQRAQVEEIHRLVCKKLLNHSHLFEKLEKEIQTELQEKLADKYFCNFSVFQSIPDAWAIEQIFPIMPLHRLNEKPTRRVTLQDMTCDSDGTMCYYIDKDRLESTLALHALQLESPYLLGIFMTGAYQEILGDLHNLFGDTDSINVELMDDGSYKTSEPERGDTIDELLRYVHFDPKELLAQCRRKLSSAINDITRQKELLREIEAGLIGYTYLED